MKQHEFDIVSINSFCGTMAIAIESYLFPFLFLYSIYDHSLFLWKNADRYAHVIHIISSGRVSIQMIMFISAVLTKFFLIVLNGLIIFGFLIRRNLHKKPEGFLE